MWTILWDVLICILEILVICETRTTKKPIRRICLFLNNCIYLDTIAWRIAIRERVRSRSFAQFTQLCCCSSWNKTCATEVHVMLMHRWQATTILTFSFYDKIKFLQVRFIQSISFGVVFFIVTEQQKKIDLLKSWSTFITSSAQCRRHNWAGFHTCLCIYIWI